MIKNERQYAATKKQLLLLEESLEKGSLNPEMPAELVAGTQNGIRSLMDDLKKELSEYEDLKQKGLGAIVISNWDDVLLVPIKYRVANNMTIEQFAQKVHVHSRQIASYEKEEYANVTMSTFRKILDEIDFNPTKYMKNVA